MAMAIPAVLVAAVMFIKNINSLFYTLLLSYTAQLSYLKHTSSLLLHYLIM